ncbi:MAG: TonB family protein [Sandaracinaceae bacterium]
MSQQDQRPSQSRSSRPGAMTMAMQAVPQRSQGPKVLRIGLIQRGKIVEERIIRQRETVTVGSSEKNHFTITEPKIGPRFELFQIVGSDYILNFTPDMNGRVSLPAGVQELAELRRTGGARNAGTYHQVKLTDSSRGKVEVGDTTLLFQFVVPPPIQPRPQLPAAVVGGFIAGIDWMFTAFVMFSFMAHFGFIIYLENADWPVEPTLGTIPDRVADLIFAPPPAPPEDTTPEPIEDGEGEEESEEEVAEVTERPTRSSDGESSTSTPAEREAQARRTVENARARVEQMLLTGLGGEGSAIADVLRNGQVIGNQADILAQSDGTAVATSSQAQLRERSGGNRVGSATSSLGDLAGSRSDRATQERGEGRPVQEVVVRGRTTIGTVTDERGSGDFNPSDAARVIRARQRAIQNCYERELRNNPTLRGRVAIQFTIQTTGSVTGARASENSTGSGALGTCVAGVIRRIRFNPAPVGGSVTLEFPFVFEPQG